ncbi:hypothetical protein [uncultured Clostridium sp.]|uniref:hypothetical protein n=1 Tax=uncultured Clostridium sp. TaxID=59620 RepID=UPI0026F3FBAB|nr:hypothetical protein [uncultured Clostridium sp.]
MKDEKNPFIINLKMLLDTIGKTPYGYHINVNGNFIKNKDGNNIAVKIEKNRLIFGVIREVEGYENNKLKKMIVESKEAEEIVFDEVSNTYIEDINLADYILPTNILVTHSRVFNCIIIKTPAYRICEKIINTKSNKLVLRVGNLEKVIESGDLIRIKRAFTNLTVENFTDNWYRYISRLTKMIGNQPKESPYVYTQVPQFRMMMFNEVGQEKLIFNPFLHIEDLANLLKSSLLWRYMQNNVTIISRGTEVYNCYFISSVEFCKATGLKNHIVFKYKGSTEDYYNLFFGLLYPSKFYNKNAVYFIINDKDYLIDAMEFARKENVKFKTLYTEKDMYSIPELERQFFRRITLTNYLAKKMRGELKHISDSLRSEEMINAMLSPFKLVMVE